MVIHWRCKFKKTHNNKKNKLVSVSVFQTNSIWHVSNDKNSNVTRYRETNLARLDKY